MSQDKIPAPWGAAKPAGTPVIAITGTIAAGKSTLGKILAEKGWMVIDADEIVHRLYRQGAEGYRKLVDALGTSILSSSKDLDRGLLAAAMIRDPSVTATVNPHPSARSRNLDCRSRRITSPLSPPARRRGHPTALRGRGGGTPREKPLPGH